MSRRSIHLLLLASLFTVLLLLSSSVAIAATAIDQQSVGALATATKVEQTDSRLSYSGTWSTFSVGSASGGSYKRTASNTASLVIPFYGEQLDVIATKGTTMGRAYVSVDGDTASVVDLHRSSVAYQQTVFTTGTLTPGYHTVKITRDPGSLAGQYVNIDAVRVVGSLASATWYEMGTSQFVWAGSWTRVYGSAYSGGGYRYTNSPGASVTVNFSGLRASLICNTAPKYGIASLRLDGSEPIAIDLYSSTARNNVVVWTSAFLTPGNHTLTFAWTGDKRAAATQTTVNLNSVGIIGSLQTSDTTPDAFSFAAQTDVPLSSLIVSDTVTISGLNAAAPISVVGGEYSVDGGAFTSVSGTIGNGQTVAVRHTSSANFGSEVTTTLTIGGVSATLSSTTLAAAAPPTFAPVSDAIPNRLYISNAYTVAGLAGPAAISISGGGGRYRVNGGTWRDSSSTVSNGSTVEIKLVSSSGFLTSVTTTLTIGADSGDFTVTTAAFDDQPDSFSFAPVTGAALDTLIMSEAVTLTGLTAPTYISVSGAPSGSYVEYQVKLYFGTLWSAWETMPTVVESGYQVRVRVRSSTQPSSTVTATLTIGGVSAPFSVTTAGS